jgi:flagellin
VLIDLNASIVNVNQALGALGSQAKQITAHTDFVSKLTDVLTTGVGNLVDADLAKESARLQALQVQQQLGAQALSIANQAPQVILQLFK